MPQICHKCQHEGRLLDGVSRISWFDYFRCDGCGHVWIDKKSKTDSSTAIEMVEGGLVIRRPGVALGPVADNATDRARSRR